MKDLSRNTFRGGVLPLWAIGCFLSLAIFGACVVPSLSSDFPYGRPDGYVTDRAGLISPGAKEKISLLIGELESKTGAQIAVATMATLEDGEIKSAAVSIFKEWGIGKKGKDNGILILLALKERKVDIEIGYGLERVITDGMAGEIIRTIMGPAFKAGDYDTGFYKAVEAIAYFVAKDAGVTLSGTMQAPAGEPENNHEKLVWGVFIAFFLLSWGMSQFAGGRRGSGGMWYGGGWGGGGMGGGGWSGGGGGGFGGFGGGMSGGGGASGGW